ncbi:hypothetical protein JOQ06_024014, partial [Pogonophryne albipinna]
ACQGTQPSSVRLCLSALPTSACSNPAEPHSPALSRCAPSSVTRPPGRSLFCPGLPFPAKNLFLAAIQGV